MKKNTLAKNLRTEWPLHLFLLPAVILLLIFSYFPMVGILIAFQDYVPSKGWDLFFKSEWVGLDNFKYIMSMPGFWTAMRNTLIIAIQKIAVSIFVPLVLALLLNEVKNTLFKKSVQTIVYTGIYKDKDVVIRDLRKRLYRDCKKLTGGFTGAPIMCRSLAENGLEDEAFYFLLQEGYPGWLNCVNLGATTIWERWNSVLQDGRISGANMNSLNHYAYGAVVEFLYRDVAGLKCEEAGFRKVTIAPMLNAHLGYTKLRYESVYGTYRTEWEILKDGKVRISIEIPFGCTAKVKLPHYAGAEIGELTAGCYEYTYQPTVEVRAKYTIKTMFKDMLSDEQAVAVIKQYTPMLMYFLGSGNEDFLHETPETLMNMGFMGFREEAVKKLQEEITKII